LLGEILRRCRELIRERLPLSLEECEPSTRELRKFKFLRASVQPFLTLQASWGSALEGRGPVSDEVIQFLLTNIPIVASTHETWVDLYTFVSASIGGQISLEGKRKPAFV
jgi:hypothetical protein